jgi:hypothetical protein
MIRQPEHGRYRKLNTQHSARYRPAPSSRGAVLSRRLQGHASSPRRHRPPARPGAVLKPRIALRCKKSRVSIADGVESPLWNSSTEPAKTPRPDSCQSPVMSEVLQLTGKIEIVTHLQAVSCYNAILQSTFWPWSHHGIAVVAFVYQVRHSVCVLPQTNGGNPLTRQRLRGRGPGG